MNKIKHIYRTTILSLLFILLIKNISFASHAMGGDITYRCLGSNQYEITFSFYRDCSGIPAPPTMNIDITSGCFTVAPVTIYPTPGSPTQISPLCPTGLSTCNGGLFTGIQEWIYQGVITLPGACSDWTFSHSENARNAAITTITGSGTDDLFVYTKLNNTNSICDDSPTFANKPVPFACVGQQFCFNHGAFDLQGDSLVYQIITPRNGPSSFDTVTYLPGYSASQPVISNPPMTFNSSTGDFCMNPQQQDVTVLAILVNEYRNGLLIGQVERDIQLTVLSCSNSLPILEGLNGTTSFTEPVCINQVNCFTITSIDFDAANTTFITWDQSLPNTTFTNTGGHRDTATICWTPTSADTSSQPYCFTAMVSDDNCPYFGIQIYSYCFIIDTTTGCSPLKIEDLNKKKSGLNIFPQPAIDLLSINFGDDYLSMYGYQLKIDNLLGETIFQSPVKEQIMKINLDSRFSSGLNMAYLINKEGKVINREKFAVIR